MNRPAGLASNRSPRWAFFEKFDKEDLAFLYQDETSAGKTSRFCKFIRKPK